LITALYPSRKIIDPFRQNTRSALHCIPLASLQQKISTSVSAFCEDHVSEVVFFLQNLRVLLHGVNDWSLSV
jgi:hypothetical protein